MRVDDPTDSIPKVSIHMNMGLELVPLPIVDPERSKAFYTAVGFDLDHDVEPGNGMRVIQFTPPASACSIVFGSGIGDGPEQGTVKNLHLVVDDIGAVRTQLARAGVGVTEVNDLGGVLYAYFSDPDGNSWALQQINSRTLPAVGTDA